METSQIIKSVRANEIVNAKMTDFCHLNEKQKTFYKFEMFCYVLNKKEKHYHIVLNTLCDYDKYTYCMDYCFCENGKKFKDINNSLINEINLQLFAKFDDVLSKDFLVEQLIKIFNDHSPKPSE